MRVQFVYSVDNAKQYGKPLRSWSAMQHGISYLSSILKANGHETSLIVLGSNLHDKSIAVFETAVAEFQPAIICFSSVYSQHRFIEEVAHLTRDVRPDIFLIAGGVHATLQPEAVIGGPFDAICVGEGEFPLLELCHQLQARQTPQGIANLWIKNGNSVQKNEPRQFLQDLDVLPLPDFEMWKPWISAPENDPMTVFAGRGCPYDCTYCSNHALRRVATGRYVRTRSPEAIVKEVEFLYRTFSKRDFYFEVETLDCNTEWTLELCSKLEAFNASVPLPATFGSNYRINPHTIDERLFAALKRANFTSINIGLEAGSERIRREVLKRNYSNDDFLTVVALARKYGLKIYLYNMIGLPGESREDHKETVRLNRLCQPEGHHTGIFYPYPGTALHDTCAAMGLIGQGLSAERERRHPVIDLPDFSKSEIERAFIWFDYHVFRGYKPLWKILIQTVLLKIDSTPAAKHVYQKMIYPVIVLRQLLKGSIG